MGIGPHRTGRDHKRLLIYVSTESSARNLLGNRVMAAQRHPLRASPAAVRTPRLRPQNHRLGKGPDLETAERSVGDAGGELTRTREVAQVEAALFLADEPLPARKLAALAGLEDAGAARRVVGRLRELYEKGESAFQVEELAGGYQLLTRAEFHPWLVLLRKHAPEIQLSTAARETLSIVAYRQPITRADIEAIRGVGSAEILKLLMEKGLVRLAGREDSLGRPALYETTKKFLQVFGLKSLKELPPGEGLHRSSAATGKE